MAKVWIWHPVLLALTVSLSHPTWAEEAEKDWRSTCKVESMMAGLPMINRQYGLQDLHEWMDVYKGNAQMEDLHIRAFREPVHDSDFDKDKAVTQFRTEIYLECVNRHKPKTD